ncbi:hypothetical protein LZ30DRAFT_257951 [Colletotrichum cereale]|nr:hypothetical protein LZ30DRAFT_257951 [Colletotrichum cereale]
MITTAGKGPMPETVRPIDTVTINEELKQPLLKDIQSFLDPKARSRYARRGLPYRRGYLLYGRRATGKSSLGMSVTGYLGLDIYVLSLAALNDGQLSDLFRELPQRCVVLLEDVDAVGTTQRSCPTWRNEQTAVRKPYDWQISLQHKYRSWSSVLPTYFSLS